MLFQINFFQKFCSFSLMILLSQSKGFIIWSFQYRSLLLIAKQLLQFLKYMASFQMPIVSYSSRLLFSLGYLNVIYVMFSIFIGPLYSKSFSCLVVCNILAFLMNHSHRHKPLQDPNFSSSNYSHLILNRDTKTAYWKKGSIPQQITMIRLGSHMLKFILRPLSLTPYENNLTIDRRSQHKI